jgi:Flp pilus assembly protein TadD
LNKTCLQLTFRRIAAPKVSMPALKKLIALAVLGIAISATLAQAADRKAAVEQVSFGIDAAKNGLWREATYRWERAVELDPSYAAAFNNLAIAYEQAGLFEKAKQAYQKAAELDPKNTYIKQNIDLFKEINDRANRQNAR